MEKRWGGLFVFLPIGKWYFGRYDLRPFGIGFISYGLGPFAMVRRRELDKEASEDQPALAVD